MQKTIQQTTQQPIQQTTQQPPVSELKRKFLLQTVMLMQGEFEPDSVYHKDLDGILDTICHTAPEIMSNRWKTIYNYCKDNINDFEKTSHANCLKIYTSRINTYNDLYKS